MFNEMVRQGWISPPREDWKAERDHSYARHLASLDAFYYVKGQQRLENLEAWAHGRARRIRPPDPIFPPHSKPAKSYQPSETTAEPSR
jgi:hypothetical protein